MNKNSFSRSRREYLWYYAPLILWVTVIFVASSSTGSMTNTSLIIRPLLLWLVPDISEASLQIIHGYVRKTAHFGFYFALGILAARAFAFHHHNLKKLWFVAALALVFGVAVVDETNQSFLASRTGSFYDVLLDTVGGSTAIILWLVGRGLKKNELVKLPPDSFSDDSIPPHQKTGDKKQRQR